MPFVRNVIAVGLAAMVWSACSPTSPCDPRAQFSFNALEVSCIAASSDAQCAATAKIPSNYTCGPTSADVTSTATFISSDPSVAAFGLPGQLPEQLVDLAVNVRNATSQVTVPNASLVVTPDKGPLQTSVTDQFGHGQVFVRHGVLVIAATAAGFQPGQTTITPGLTSISVSVTLNLFSSGS